MDQTHIHLVITHLPIFGTALGAFVLAHAIWFRSRSAMIAACNLLLLSAIGGGIAFLTGEAAEEAAEPIAGVSGAVIHAHEESAELTIIVLGIVGLVSFVGLILAFRTRRFKKGLTTTIFIAALISSAFAGYTGYLGGQIRHTEIHGASAPIDIEEATLDELENEEAETDAAKDKREEAEKALKKQQKISEKELKDLKDH
ncbi:MAG TPA: hypothetical protein VF581_12010 [Flavobacterium sp.]|jgi:uncharacterized membrane protein